MSLSSRRRFLAGTVTAAVAAMLAACAPPQPTFTPAPPTPAPKPTEAPKPSAAAPTTAPAAGAPTTAPAVGATPAPAAAAAKPGAAPVKLTFWTHNYQPLVTFVEKKVKEYKAETGNVDIDYSNTTVPDHEKRI